MIEYFMDFTQFPPLDIVFTYVNSNDPSWIYKKNQYLHQFKNPALNQNKRFNFLGEILFSLRLLERFMPWVHKIYIIHDQQTFPIDFLSESFRQKIQFVDHQEIIPQEFLPTFNSQVIEIYMWKIPNLSDHFLYMNDDFFIGNYVSHYDFFNHDGKMKLFHILRFHPMSARILRYQNVLIDREISAELFHEQIQSKKKLYVTFGHFPFCFHKATCEKAYEIFQPFFNQTSLNKFRRYDSFYHYVHHRNDLSHFHNFSALVIYQLMMLYTQQGVSSNMKNSSFYHCEILTPATFVKILYSRPKFFNVNGLDHSQMYYWNELRRKYLPPLSKKPSTTISTPSPTPSSSKKNLLTKPQNKPKKHFHKIHQSPQKEEKNQDKDLDKILLAPPETPIFQQPTRPFIIRPKLPFSIQQNLQQNSQSTHIKVNRHPKLKKMQSHTL